MKGRRRDAELAADLCHRRPALRLPRREGDLLIRLPFLLHGAVPSSGIKVPKNLRPRRIIFQGRTTGLDQAVSLDFAWSTQRQRTICHDILIYQQSRREKSILLRFRNEISCSDRDDRRIRPMQRLLSGISVLALLAASACQQMPTGPTASEGVYNSFVAQCSAQGGRDRRGQDACAQANNLAQQVSSERAIRDQQAGSVAQNNAVAAGVAAGAAGLVGGAVIGGALSGPGYGYYGHRGYRCGYGWC